jgi:DNA-binding response OmpR family regulator
MNTGTGYLLVVEDDPDILKLLQTTLTFSGYRVVTTRNGKEGLEAVKKERPAVIIADIMMPKLDGFGLVHRLRIDPETRSIPVVFITATYVTREDKDFAMNIGATRFIQKPVDLEKLLVTITDLFKENLPVTLEPLNELSFYQGYRQRLEAKLDQKTKQMARDELLLGLQEDEGNQYLRASLAQAISECEELRLLLNQVDEQLEKYTEQG